MTRILLLIALGVIAYLFLRRWLAARNSAIPPPVYAPMVSCTHCGIHLPRERAIERAGRYYCCPEHAEGK